METKVVEEKICPECHQKTQIIEDTKRGEFICSGCGVVLGEKNIDLGPEWRIFADEHDVRIRAGSPPAINIFNKGMGTFIGKNNVDANKNKLNKHQRETAYKIRKWQSRGKINSGLERNLSVAMSDLNLFCSQLGVSKNIKRMAASLYRSAIERKKLRVKEIRGTVIAAIYIASRKCGASLTFNTFRDKLGTERKKLNKDVRKLREVLQIDVLPADPNNFVSRYCHELKLSMRTQRKVFALLKKAMKSKSWSGKNPIKSLGGIIYIATVLEGERRTQREIAEVCEVSEVTVRNRYKEICIVLKLGAIGL